MTSLSLWMVVVLVSGAGAIGALMRYAATVTGMPQPGLVRRRITAINVAGAFGAGMVVAIDHPLAVVLSVGLFGSLTTLSTIAVWWADDFRQGKPIVAVRNISVHVLLGVPAVVIGFLIGQMLL
jgi:fluoride exporter